MYCLNFCLVYERTNGCSLKYEQLVLFNMLNLYCLKVREMTSISVLCCFIQIYLYSNVEFMSIDGLSITFHFLHEENDCFYFFISIFLVPSILDTVNTCLLNKWINECMKGWDIFENNHISEMICWISCQGRSHSQVHHSERPDKKNYFRKRHQKSHLCPYSIQISSFQGQLRGKKSELRKVDGI